MRTTKNVQIGPEDTYQEKLGDRDATTSTPNWVIG